MSEIKLPRLLAAAKEFNVGQDTIIDFLAKKGFNKDDLKPTAKLSESMYAALQAEFQSDKQAKNKADQVEIPKSVQTERKRKDEEDFSFAKKEEKKPAPVVKEEPVAAPVVIPAFPFTEKEPAKPAIVEVVEPTPPPVQPEVKVVPEPVVVVEKQEPQPAAPIEEPTIEQIPAPAPEPVEEAPAPPQVIRLDAPEIEGPKIINKIDLSAIDSSTRPRKVNKPVEQAPPAEEVAPPAPVEAVKAPVVAPTPPASVAEPVKEVISIAPKPIAEAPKPVEVEQVQEPSAPIIENIEVEKLTGPKILGKIQLPVDSDTRPKPTDRNEPRKRKRIPVDKRQGGGHHGGGQHNQHGGGHQQGGNPQARGPQSAPATGPNRPVVPAQPRGGNQGGGFNRDNNRPQHGGGNQGGGFNRDNNRGGGGQRGNYGNRGNDFRREDKEIDAKEIQDKIKETQAKLAGGGGKGKSIKAKNRRARREEAAEALSEGMSDNKLQVTEFVTVSELANLMDVSFAEVIGKCMGLGIMVSINQRLDAEVIELVASEFDYEVEFIGVDDIEED
ncbi:MAG: translation initiation factor IF-2 N-terminal domain-containing protein, partial [Chitinophagaceae bacterium]